MAAAPVSAHAYVCDPEDGPTHVQVQLYDFDNLSGFLGRDCNNDSDFSNGVDSTTTNINDAANSASLTGVAGQTWWCVHFFVQSGFHPDAGTAVYRVHNGADLHVDFAAALDNAFSSMSQNQVAFGAAC